MDSALNHMTLANESQRMVKHDILSKGCVYFAMILLIKKAGQWHMKESASLGWVGRHQKLHC